MLEGTLVPSPLHRTNYITILERTTHQDFTNLSSTSITGSLILSLHCCWLLRLWSPQSCFYSLNVDTDKNIEYSNISGYFTQYAANVLKNLEIIIVKTRPSSTLDVKLFLGPLPPHPLISRLEQVIHFNWVTWLYTAESTPTFTESLWVLKVMFELISKQFKFPGQISVCRVMGGPGLVEGRWWLAADGQVGIDNDKCQIQTERQKTSTTNRSWALY